MLTLYDLQKLSVFVVLGPLIILLILGIQVEIAVIITFVVAFMYVLVLMMVHKKENK